jgi:hypothetical protein
MRRFNIEDKVIYLFVNGIGPLGFGLRPGFWLGFHGAAWLQVLSAK